ncbi:amino acid adenylation domain-containing protein [Sphingomonas sp. MMS12-HWE2-04]|uniref:non-ribosomal peptide synthetase n=1 Tax=Sphingomonas sp. MMS12-HWE2-04 TaxID=3234199 RepID=UPI00384DEB2B
MAEARGRLRELSTEQRALLLRRLAAERCDAIPPHDGEEAPLSFAQERQWFLDRMSPGDPAHVIAGALRLEGDLSVAALQAAFDAIVRRHETLRARFDAASGQSIAAFAPLPIRRVDLFEAEALRLYAAETEKGFDLTREAPLRITLIRIAADDHLLVFALHHIAGDGWSIGVLLDELARGYTGLEVAPLPIAYRDYAAWQRRRLDQGGLARSLDYWREQLRDAPPVLELPADHPGERDYAGAALERRIAPALRQRLDAIGQAEGGSLFVTLLTAYLVLLMRLTAREDLIVGTPVSGRTRLETEPLIGLFLNTLPVRVGLTPDLSFREALARVRSAVIDGIDHGEVPFDRIVKAVAPERAAASHPLFETLFNFTPTPPRALFLGSVGARFVAPGAPRCEFSTTLYVSEWQGGLDLKLAYQSARYSEARIAALLGQYATLLEQAAAEPNWALGDFDLVTAGAPLADPSAPIDMPAHRPVTEQILGWAARTPDAPALRHSGGTLRYRDFALAMGGVAAQLRAAGMRPGDVVAVHGPRCPQLVAAMAGVLHAGGVLLTLSPDLPEGRRAAMAEHARARFLLHAGARPDWLGECVGLALGDERADPGAGAPARGPCDPAYIFFTSGSTGVPKAVRGTAAGLAHFLDWQRDTFAVGPGDRCGQLTGLSFDVVLRDVFLPLVSGAELVLPDQDAATLEWLAAEQITLLHAVPSIADAWLIEAQDATLPALRMTFFAGEPLSGTLAGRWRAAFAPNSAVINLYGPTETTLAKCYHVLGSAGAGVQPLGRPLPQTQVIVVTPALRRCGVGELGEIAIRTPFRSLGYLDAEAETTRRFVRNPFGTAADDLLYLTGDRGLIDAEGVLQFRGRIDGQVKLRGVRIEPSEVAAVLRTSPDVAACAVVMYPDTPTGPMLAAYVVAHPESERSARGLRDYLRQRLPRPMVPQAFAFLDALPLTANHKLDRAQLPPIVAAGAERYIAPRDTIELQIAQIWEELLGIDRIGVVDSFFDLGGHSLLAMRLLVRIEQRLGRKLLLSALFENPTIEHFANLVRRQETVDSQLVRLWAGKGGQILFLVHTGGGTVLNYVPLVRNLAPALPVYAVQAGGLSGEAPPLADVSAMAADYVARLRGLQPFGPYRIGGHSFGGVVAYEMARQLCAAGEQVALLALFDSALVRPNEEEAAVTPENSVARDLAAAVTIFRRFTGMEVSIDYAALCALAVDDQIARVAEAFARNGSLPAEDGAQLVRNLLAVAQAHRTARRRYRPKSSPVPITLFRASDSDRTGEETLGWRQVAGAPVRVEWVRGDHVTMMAERNAAELAERLSACLAETLVG